MEQLVLKSVAKVNLALDVRQKRPEDGYHYVQMIMLPVDLADTIMLQKADAIAVTVSPAIPGPPEANLAYRAARLLQQSSGYQGGARIHIDKQIPVAGGMAGGSTNAATVLKGLNELWGTGLSQTELIDLAIRLGADVPFFIAAAPARVEGIGERLTPIAVANPLWLVVVTPDVAKTTGGVYGLFDELQQVDRPDVAGMEVALATGDLQSIAAALGNVFEQVMLPRHPEIGALKDELRAAGAIGTLMSGAGPTVFGLVEDAHAGQAVVERLKDRHERLWLVQTSGSAQ